MPCPKAGRFTAASRRSAAAAAERGLGWGKKSAVLTADSPLPDPFLHTSYHSLQDVFLALGHDFGTENPASKRLFTTPVNLRHRLCTLFFLAVSTTCAPRPPLVLNPSPILVRGPESEISEG